MEVSVQGEVVPCGTVGKDQGDLCDQMAFYAANDADPSGVVQVGHMVLVAHEDPRLLLEM